MQRFGESVSFDARLAEFDIQGSQAHAKMLGHVGLITAEESAAIVAGLEELRREVAAGNFNWRTDLEDVHMNLEQALTERVPAGAKLHTARSRNDQIATDMRLWFRWACAALDADLVGAMQSLVSLAQRGATVAIPGYTHLQRAQPVTVAHHLLAHVEMLQRDRQRLARVAEDAGVCPLGSGAIAGTTLPIDRAFVARELGFVDAEGQPRLTMNSMDAVADRDLFLDFAHACAVCSVHLSRLAEDIILWNSAEFGFIRLPDAFTTGSSLMPQKKNPDSFELLRGKAARCCGNLQTILMLCKGLPLTYNRDLQDDKPPIFDSFDQLSLALRVVAGSLLNASINESRCAAAVADPLLLATDLADYLVLRGVPFREAHHAVGRLVALAEHHQCPLPQLSDEVARGVHQALGEDWRSVFNLNRAFSARERPGMPGPQTTRAALNHWRVILGGMLPPRQ